STWAANSICCGWRARKAKLAQCKESTASVDSSPVASMCRAAPRNFNRRYRMNNQRLVVSSALASVLALGLLNTAAAADAPGAKEKCFGIAKAGKNDCANLSGSHSCAGQSKDDMGPAEWNYVAKGTCKDMKGMSEDEAKAKIAKK